MLDTRDEKSRGSGGGGGGDRSPMISDAQASPPLFSLKTKSSE